MKIVVCVKQVPDSEAKVSAEGEKISWGEAPLVINPFDEYAVEAALLQKEAAGGTVTALCLGPDAGREALKHALAMGADEAVLISEEAQSVIDTLGAAHILAAAVNKLGEADLVLFGRQTLDDGSGLTASQTARLLGWPMLGFVGHIQVEGKEVQVSRVIEEGRQNAKAPLPVVMSIVQSIGEPRYPSFMGIRKASKATIPVWTLADLGIDTPAPHVSRTELMTPPSHEVKCEIIEGDSAQAIAATLVDKILAEKVL